MRTPPDSFLASRLIGFVASLTRSVSGFHFAENLLGALKDSLGFRHTAFIYFDTESFAASFPIHSRLPDSAMARYHESYDEEAIFLRAVKVDRRLLARKYLGIEDVISLEDYERSVYYRDIIKPSGSRDVVVLPIAGKRRVAGGLAIMKPEGEGNFSPAEHRLFALLNEPVTALFESNLEILGMRSELEMEGVAYENLDIGVIIADQDGTPRRTNAAAERLCQSLYPGEARQAVTRLLEALRGRRAPGLVRLESFPRFEGSPIDIKVVPKTYLTPDRGMAYRSIIYLERSEPSGDQGRFERFVAAYALSRREQEIVAHILEGEDNAMIAAKLCLSGNTVRTHLQNIYSKLSISSRISIIQLYRAAT